MIAIDFHFKTCEVPINEEQQMESEDASVRWG